MYIKKEINKTKFYTFILAILIVFGQCKNEPAVQNNAALEIEHDSFSNSQGDCNKTCVSFKAVYPVIKAGTPALRDSVKQWIEVSAAEMCVQTEEVATPKMSIQESANAFAKIWQEGDTTASYAFEMKDTVLMANSKFVAFRLDMYIFTGGAHPNIFTKLAVFNTSTGALVPATSFIKDEKAILPLLDIAYKAEKREAFEAGNAYMDGAISFPSQCAFTEKGVLFHYNTYEIAPYVMGDADIFMTWTDLEQSAVNPN